MIAADPYSSTRSQTISTLGVLSLLQFSRNDNSSLVLTVALSHFSKVTSCPWYGLPLLRYAERISGPHKQEVSRILKTYEEEIAFRDISHRKSVEEITGFVDPFFRDIGAALKASGGLREKLSQDRSELVLSIAQDLQKSGNHKELVNFLCRQHVTEFRNPTLRDLLNNAFRDGQRFIGILEFPELAKKLLYGYLWEPESLRLLVEGGEINGHQIPPLIETPGVMPILRDLLAFCKYESPQPPPESQTIIQNALTEICRPPLKGARPTDPVPFRDQQTIDPFPPQPSPDLLKNPFPGL